MYQPNRSSVTTDDAAGGCPLCGRNDGCVDTGNAFWCVCHRHKVRWDICSDAGLPYDLDELSETEAALVEAVMQYRRVDPLDVGEFARSDICETIPSLN